MLCTLGIEDLSWIYIYTVYIYIYKCVFNVFLHVFNVIVMLHFVELFYCRFFRHLNVTVPWSESLFQLIEGLALGSNLSSLSLLLLSHTLVSWQHFHIKISWLIFLMSEWMIEQNFYQNKSQFPAKSFENVALWFC